MTAQHYQVMTDMVQPAAFAGDQIIMRSTRNSRSVNLARHFARLRWPQNICRSVLCQ
jgi:hypothetical protein